MKKVLCNVLYGVNIPVYHKELGNTSLDLGLFEEEEDAICAGMLTNKILEKENEFDFLSVEDFEVQKEYYPDSEMTSQRVTSRLNEDLNAFVTNNTYTNYYADKKGFVDLSMLLIDCLETCMKKDVSSNNPKQQGE